jgi:triacylglycerol lipase
MLKMLIVFLLSSTNLWSKDLSTAYLNGRDQTLVNEVRALQKFKVLIIPGVLAQSFISDSSNQIKLSFLFEDAFKEQINMLETLKIDYELLKLETENSPAKNAQVVIEAIEKSSLPVLVYSHSKGGLDMLEAIRQKPAIHGWASIQSPFWGAPVGSEVNNNLILRDSGNNLFEWMGGDASGMSSLTIEERVPYMDSDEIKKILVQTNQKIKFINYASYKTNTFGIDTPLELFRNYTDGVSGQNDGVVPLTSALIKEHGVDVNYIIEAEVDHLMTMSRYRLNNNQYNQKTHTIAVLKLLL